jgi:putative acetyltransferase
MVSRQQAHWQHKNMIIKIDELINPKVEALLNEHVQNMYNITPRESVHVFAVDQLRKPDITFWTAWSGEELLGCGALRELSNSHGEVKSMRTASQHLRKGVAREILRTILAEARRRKYTRVSLETGAAIDFEPAQKLYERFGFQRCSPFGEYKEDPNSVFMTLEL